MVDDLVHGTGEEEGKHAYLTARQKKEYSENIISTFCFAFYYLFTLSPSLYLSIMSGKEDKEENKPGVEHRDPQYFGYYAMLQHQVLL